MSTARPIRVLTAEPLSVGAYWRELVKYRSLIWVFAWQEIKAAYAQTYLGIMWAVFRPLLILAIFTVLFNYLLKIQTTTPYYLFAFCGMIAWNFFQQVSSTASASIAQRQDVIRKMYFPKLVLPIAKVLVAGVELLVSLGIILVMIIAEQHKISWHVVTLPLFLLLNICCGMAVALWMNALNIRYRDLSQIITPVISIGIWFTPVFFPTTIIPPKYHFLIYFNPMAGVIEGFRFSLLGEPFPAVWYFVSITCMVILFLTGAWYLTRVEDEIVDYG